MCANPLQTATNMNRVNTDYSRTKENELSTLADDVYSSLKNNPDFSIDEKTMADLLLKITDYREKLQKAMHGGIISTNAKKDAKKALTDHLSIIANEVNRQAGGNILLLDRSGFILAKKWSPVGPLPKPEGLKAERGLNSGELLVSVNAYSKADYYIFYIAEVPPPVHIKEYRTIHSRRSRTYINDLTPGKEYEIICLYLGSSKTYIYSDPIRIFAS